MCFRRQFLPNMWPIQLVFLLFLCSIFPSSLALCNTSFPTWKVQLIFSKFLHHHNWRRPLWRRKVSWQWHTKPRNKALRSRKQPSVTDDLRLCDRGSFLSALWQMWGTSCGIFQCFAGKKNCFDDCRTVSLQSVYRVLYFATFLFCTSCMKVLFHVVHFSRGFLTEIYLSHAS